MNKIILYTLFVGSFITPLFANDNTVTVKCITGLKFDTTEITAKVGEKVLIKLENPDIMPHNLVIVKPGTSQTVATAAMGLGAEGMAKGYIPETEDIIAATKLLKTGEEDTIELTFDQPGTYPYICTFPGHYVIMKGTITVQ